jgi:hypothetical protein
MHDFRRPRPCCTHGCFPPLEPILSPTRDLRSSKKLLPRHFHYPPPDGHSPGQNNTHDRGLLMAKLLNRTLTRSLRTPFIITPSHRRSIGPHATRRRQPLVCVVSMGRSGTLLFTRCSYAGFEGGNGLVALHLKATDVAAGPLRARPRQFLAPVSIMSLL